MKKESIMVKIPTEFLEQISGGGGSGSKGGCTPINRPQIDRPTGFPTGRPESTKR